MTPQVQAIVVREIRDSRNDGFGQTPDETYGQISGVVTQIIGYFDNVVQQNPNDLLAPRLAELVRQLPGLLSQYNSEVYSMLKAESDKLAACQAASAAASTQASTQIQQAQAAGGVSPPAAAGIAVASAIVGGLAGYAVRGKL